jgi:ABC-type polysaccharide/polyol phosphate export permease
LHAVVASFIFAVPVGRRDRRREGNRVARPVAQHDYWFITRELTLSAFKLRDQGSLLGFLWTLLQPLAMLSVLYWLFRGQMGQTVRPFGLYLLIGLVLWTFFASGTGKGLLSLVMRRDLIGSVTFPREIIVVSAVLTVVLSSTLEFGVVLLFTVATGAGISWAWLWLPLILLMECMLVIGCSLLLAPWYVHVRDLDNIWTILVRVGFFVTPVFYDPSLLLSAAEYRIYQLNPITQLMNFARDVLLQQQAPPLGALAATFVFCALLLAGGFVNFRYFAPDLAEHI